MSEEAPLLRVCSLLNRHNARYLIVGARAILKFRKCCDNARVVFQIFRNENIYIRGRANIAVQPARAAAELKPHDFVENIVVKIADEVEVDVSTRAWTVSYADAIVTTLKITIEGVEVPYIDLQMLTRSKSTQREQDKVDIQRLRSLTADS